MLFQLGDISRKCERASELAIGLAKRSGRINLGLAFIGPFLQSAHRAPVFFDENISFNVEIFKDRFEPDLDDFLSSGGDLADGFFVKCYRMIVELKLSCDHDLDDALERAYSDAQVYAETLEGPAKEQVRYVQSYMAIQIVKRFVHHPKMPELRNLSSTIDDANQVIGDFERQLSAREVRAEILADKLKQYESAFNFVGLFDGFRGLRKQKKLESRFSLSYLAMLGFLLLLIPAGKVWAEINGLSLFSSYGAILSALGFELILVFLFKVGLQGYRSVKAQLLQIELRMALCQFIESYAGYAQDLRAKDKDLLTRFEQVIFSGIVSSDAAIPSTFDGIDQIASLIAAIKKA